MLDIEREQIPIAGTKLFREPVSHLLGVLRPDGEREPESPDEEELNATAPIPVYTAPMRALLAQELMTGAVLTARQILLLHNERPLGTAEVRGSVHGHEAFVGLFEESRGLLAALLVAETLPQYAGPNNVVMIRILRIPELTFQALWLHAPAEDRFIPLRRVPDGLDGDEVYTEHELAVALLPLMVSRLKQSSRELA